MGVKTITGPVISSEIKFVFVHNQRKPYRPVGIKMPEFFTGLKVKGNDLVLIVETNE